MGSTEIPLIVLLTLASIATVATLEPCPGDTRGDRRCNFDATHRVCAKIGVQGTSFWRFTNQRSWCNTRGNYRGLWGKNLRCPADNPTWCICKWATARWIKGQGCDDTIQFDCEATDVCNLKRTKTDYGVDMGPAHACMEKKCPKQWNTCSRSADRISSLWNTLILCSLSLIVTNGGYWNFGVGFD